ncbi:phage tail assembly chaperone [Azospirillum sp. Marseille-Q6669]
MRLNFVLADWTGINGEVRRRLDATQHLVAGDYPLTDESRAALLAWRQALRDLNHTFTSPAEVVFPPQPTIEKVKA